MKEQNKLPLIHVSKLLKTEDWFQFGSEASLRKQPTFHDATTGFPAKKRLKNEFRNSILMTCYHPELGSDSNWSYRVGNLLQPTGSTTQNYVVTCHQYGISALVSQTSFRGETSGGIAKCRLFSQDILRPAVHGR